jgi:hemerythrin-like domain-containing protein
MTESPTVQLRREHELVLLVVAAMEREAESLRAGEVHAATIAQMVGFTRNFTDGCHHGKEEQVLFPWLKDMPPTPGVPAAPRDIVAVMLSEHDAGRQAIRAIAENLPAADTDEQARTTVADNLAAYARLLRMHIHKENEVLFPLADRLLDEANRERIAAEFERVEQERAGGVTHDDYERLAKQLAGEEPSGR